MPTKPTQSTVARIFAMYIGSDVQVISENKMPRVRTLVGITPNYFILSSEMKSGEWNCEKHRCSLLLTSLAEISDEDKLQISILDYGKEATKNVNEPVIYKALSLAIIERIIKGRHISLTVIDYLRSSSYALPAYASQSRN